MCHRRCRDLYHHMVLCPARCRDIRVSCRRYRVCNPSRRCRRNSYPCRHRTYMCRRRCTHCCRSMRAHRPQQSGDTRRSRNRMNRPCRHCCHHSPSAIPKHTYCPDNCRLGCNRFRPSTSSCSRQALKNSRAICHRCLGYTDCCRCN